jgi:predicted kinase
MSGFSPHKKVIVPFGKGIYSQKKSEEVYKEMLKRAEKILKEGKSCIIDASFLKKKWRKRAKEIADKLSVKFLIIAPFADEEKIKKRLLKRKKDVSDGRWEIYIRQREFHNKIDEEEKKYTVFVDNNKGKGEVEKFLRNTLKLKTLNEQKTSGSNPQIKTLNGA